MEDEMQLHWGKLETVINWVSFAQRYGYANDDEVDEVRSKIHDINLVITNISKRINKVE